MMSIQIGDPPRFFAACEHHRDEMPLAHRPNRRRGSSSGVTSPFAGRPIRLLVDLDHRSNSLRSLVHDEKSASPEGAKKPSRDLPAAAGRQVSGRHPCRKSAGCDRAGPSRSTLSASILLTHDSGRGRAWRPRMKVRSHIDAVLRVDDDGCVSTAAMGPARTWSEENRVAGGRAVDEGGFPLVWRRSSRRRDQGV